VYTILLGLPKGELSSGILYYSSYKNVLGGKITVRAFGRP
jgi:hypothetical protein